MNNFIMDYNQFTYYRANPYAKQGFMPPVAHTNRHRPDYITQMPMGQQHLGKIGKKFFTNGGKHESNIQKQHLLESPERYPYENRIAFDKHFQRNLNTIDIEGSTSGSMMAQGVRNKLKAREALMRRQKELNGKPENQLHHLQLTEEEKRRQVALQQQQRNELRTSRLEETAYERSKRFSVNHFDYGTSLQDNYHNKPNGVEKMSDHPHNQRYYQPNMGEKNIQKTVQPARYQSIQIGRPYQNPEEYPKNDQPSHSGSSLSRSKAQKEELPTIPLPKDKYQHRLQNPTNLSYENSLYRAGRNLMNNN